MKSNPRKGFFVFSEITNLIMENIYRKPGNSNIAYYPTVFRVLLFIVIILLTKFVGIAQVATNGDYRSRTSAVWSGASTWQVRSAGSWANTATAPTSSANIYIQSGHTVTVNIGTADCKDIHVNTGASVSIGTNTLQVSGKLRAYTGTVVTAAGADGVFYSSQASSTSPIDGMLVTSGAGLLKFIGATRNITNTGEWATNSTTHATEFALTAGATGTLQTGYKSSAITISSATIDMGANRLSPDNNVANQGNCTVQSGATLMSANTGGTGFSVMSRTGTTATGRAGTFTLNGKLVLSGTSPEIQFTTVNINSGSTIEYSKAGGQNFVTSTFTGAAAIGSSYYNLILSGSGSKTPAGNFAVSNDITISGTAVLPLSTLTATIGGNWTSYGTAGFTESTSTVDFNGTGSQLINTVSGEDFFKLNKSAAGTLTLNSDARFAGTSSELNISSGIMDAGTFTLSGTASTALTMSGGTLKLAKLSTTLPEFLITPSYNLLGGTIELNGAGTQTLRGSRDYRNLTFSNSGTKGISTGITNITGVVTVANTVVLDVANNSLGGAGTSLTMTGTSTYKTAGSSVTKPDATGTYSLGIGTTIEFTNAAAGLESIRLTPLVGNVTYYNIIVSGSGVGTTAGSGIKFQSGGSFTVKNAAVFKLQNTNGFSGAANTAIDNTNNPTIILEPGSTIEYNGTTQTITNQTINTPSNANYEGLTLSGTGTKTAPATLTINGNLAKAGTTLFAHNNGTVVMNGTAIQSYTAAAPVMAFYNLTNNNTVDLSTNNDLSVSRELAFGANSKLNLRSGTFTLLSDASNTANVGKIPVTATINYFSNGKFTVERYIPTGTGGFPNHLKTWQLLATPTNGLGQTVNQAWQDTAVSANQSRYAGYGTQITSNISPLPALFDVLTSPGPSMKTYNPATNSWDGIANTTTLPVYNQKGYMVFVRGDRTVTTYNGTPNASNLRTSGKIADPVSNIPPTTTVGLNQFESIGNPYASAIDFSYDPGVVKSANIDRVFYVWDPKLGGSYGYGAYQTFTRGIGADNNYYVSPGGGSYGALNSVNTLIQSGQAFFVHASAAGETVTFNEDAKVNTSSVVFRQGNSTVNPGKQLSNRLYVISGGNPVLIDGVSDQFDAGFSNSVDRLDAIKLSNFGENIAISKGNKDLAVERRNNIGSADTIFYKLGQLKVQQYEFEFTPENISRPGLKAFLEDNYLQTRNPVSLTRTTRIRFNIFNSPGSTAPGRFRLVFRQRDMPVTHNSIEREIQKNIVVYPNPVINKTLQLVFNNQVFGKYRVQLISQSGQVVLQQEINVSGNYFSRSLQLPSIVTGTYQLVIIGADGSKTSQQVIVR